MTTPVLHNILINPVAGGVDPALSGGTPPLGDYHPHANLGCMFYIKMSISSWLTSQVDCCLFRDVLKSTETA